MRIGLFIQLLLLIIWVPLSGISSQITIVSENQRSVIGDHIQLTYEIDNTSSNIKKVSWNIEQIEASDIIVLINSSSIERANKFIKNLTIAVFDTGRVDLPSIEAELFFTEGISEVQHSAQLELFIELPEFLHSELLPIKDIIEDPPPSFLWLYFTIAILILAFLILIWLFIKNRKKLVIEREPPADFSIINPEAWALEQFQKLKNVNINREDAEERYFTRLSYIFRSWLETRFKFNALEMTGNEVIQNLERRENFDSSTISELERVIIKIEHIKYAKGRSEMEFYDTSVELLEGLILAKMRELSSQKIEEDDGGDV